MYTSKFRLRIVNAYILLTIISWCCLSANLIICAYDYNYEFNNEAFNNLNGLFTIPAEKPDTIITADRLDINEYDAILSGNVKIVRNGEELTASKVIYNNNSKIYIATGTPRMFKKEIVEAKQVTREYTLDAQTILWDRAKLELYASNSVVLKIEERSWDLATYTCITISSDELKGYKEMEKLYFVGNVKINDQRRFGQGSMLEYHKQASIIVLSGNAMIETEEWDDKKKQFVKKTLKGQTIQYNVDTKFVKVE